MNVYTSRNKGVGSFMGVLAFGIDTSETCTIIRYFIAIPAL